MKFITRNLLYFSLAFAVLTIAMKYLITASLDARQFVLPWIIAALYSVITFVLGWFFGKRDGQSLPLYDTGFRFHLATYLIFTTVSELWHGLGLMSAYERFAPWRFVIVIWGIFMVAHLIVYLIARRKTIKGIGKAELFD